MVNMGKHNIVFVHFVFFEATAACCCAHEQLMLVVLAFFCDLLSCETYISHLPWSFRPRRTTAWIEFYLDASTPIILCPRPTCPFRPFTNFPYVSNSVQNQLCCHSTSDSLYVFKLRSSVISMTPLRLHLASNTHDLIFLLSTQSSTCTSLRSKFPG